MFVYIARTGLIDYDACACLMFVIQLAYIVLGCLISTFGRYRPISANILSYRKVFFYLDFVVIQ